MSVRRVVAGLVMLVLVPAVLAPGLASGPATHRPIAEFLAAQGSYSWWGDPCCQMPWSGTEPGREQLWRWAMVDSFGLANAYVEEASLGTVSFEPTMEGSVTERPLADGRAEVIVLLRTKNALCWASDVESWPWPLLFGSQPWAVAEGAAPALGESTLHLVFTNPWPGHPLPDYNQLVIEPEAGQQLLSVDFQAKAYGPLHEAFGVAEGTPGRMTVQQVGLLEKGSGKGKAAADGYVVENVKLQAVGGG